MFRTLGIQSLEKDEIEQLLARTPPWRQKPIVALVVKLKDLIEYREQTVNSFESLTQQRASNVERAEIQINQKTLGFATK